MVSPIDIAIRAKDIYDSASTEVEYRCSARCAYYSLYHHFKAVNNPLLAEPSQKGGVHYKLISRFNDSSDQELKKIGTLLNQCREIRVKADYTLDEQFKKHDAYTVLRHVEKIVLAGQKMQREDKSK